MDVKALFTNILHEDGLESLKEELDKQTNPEVPNEYILKLMEILLRHNIFTFHGESYKQDIGAPMGSAPVPDYANTFMANRIDPKIEQLSEKYNE